MPARSLLIPVALAALAACGTPANVDADGAIARLVLDEPLGRAKADAVSDVVLVQGSLENGGSAAGKLELGETWGWTFTVPSDTYVRASIYKTEDAPFYPAAYVYGPVVGASGGRRLAEDRARDASFPETVVQKAGTYLVVVQDPGGTWPAKFGVKLDWVKSACAGVACSADGYRCAAGSRAHLCVCEAGVATAVEICDAKCVDGARGGYCDVE